MQVCPSCARENADDASFCSGCGTALAAPSPAREERKVVTCLFCDLVGFTARAERMDPEDVRRLLQPYHASVRSELERFGGTVEKFIGDAVMAVFGAPLAHEDDPERAVRAALAIRDQLAEDGELEVRIGITTAEALVALDARPEAGEGMASGDVVNTAARLEAAAPSNGILVDETTFRATERAIEYALADAVAAKGKSRSIAVWEVVRTRARVGVERLSGTPLVGRDEELALLRDTLARVIREEEPQLVTLVGVPGIGKSRLVFELFETIRVGELGPGLVLWRHGRSLPYGEGVTFWALAEMVKAQAGILESDRPGQASEKLHAAVAAVVPAGVESEWVERHLRPLVGLDGEEPSAEDRHGEAFAAWRRFFEELAESRPLVLVFEDLHWADEQLLDFVDQLVDRARGVPLLALCTARPELLERRPAWGGGKVNAATTLLSALSDDETSELVLSLLDHEIAPDVRERLLAHAEGNPLYAEEFSRALAERPTAALPETVQGLIAARLDTLPPEEKAILQDAAVFGRVFWLGALARERWTLEERLHSLERKEFVRRERRSSVAGEEELVFRHALVRDVAYEQIPRAERADKHRAAAEWIQSLGRPEDHAETIAYHWGAALDYARGAGQYEPYAKRYVMRYVAALIEAGDRAFALNASGRAAQMYEQALNLLPEDHPQRPRLLLALGRALWLSEARGVEELIAARDALLAANDRDGAADAEALVVEALWNLGRRDEAARRVDAASALAQELEPSRAKAVLLSSASRMLMRAGDFPQAASSGREAIELAETLDLEELRVSMLASLGPILVELGDEEAGLAALEESIEAAKAIGSVEALRGYNNLSHQFRHRGEFVRSMELLEEGLRLSDRLENVPQRLWFGGMLPHMRYRQGRWDEAVALADSYLEEVPASHYHRWHALGTRALVRLSRGDESGIEDAHAAIRDARSAVDPGNVRAALEVFARMLVLVGRADEARAAMEEALAIPGRAGFDLPMLVVTAFELGEDGERVLAQARPSAWAEAAKLYFAGDFAGAADVYREIGSPTDEAEARLRAAKSLLGDGEQAEGEAQLEQALAFYRSVGATRFVREGEALIVAAT